MKQILTLSITALKEKLYVAFMIIVKNMLDEFEVMDENFEYYVAQFNAAYNRLNFVYLKTDLKFYTEQVQEHDTLRCNAFRALRDMVRFNFTYPDNSQKKEAARILLEVIKLYGTDIPSMRLDEKTSQLVNLIEDFEDKYQSQVETIGVGDLLEALRQAQDKFMTVYSARTEADSSFGLKAMAEARKVMDVAYRDLVTAVNLEAKRDSDGVLTDFINNLNVEIRKQFVNTGQNSNSTSSDSSSEVSPTVKTATFNFANGNSVKLRVEVGAPLDAPSNTEGYEWRPEVPEFMPATNKTFHEVAIGTEEFSATFHFADHSEEVVQQPAGTALIAPANTEGYYWDPEVPAIMPAEDTAYYELPITLGDDNENEDEPGSGDETPATYSVTWKDTDGTVLHVQNYEVGATIVAPTPPTGCTWGYYPTTMPERDVIVTAIDSGSGV